MYILLTGASGFLGRHFLTALRARGHTVRCAVRKPDGQPQEPGAQYVQVDFIRDSEPAAWRAHLRGIDVVINAVGILRESGAQTFDAVHTRTPQGLFRACVDSGVRRVIQISALGADDAAVSAFHRSKKAADDYLLNLPLDAVVVQPSLVFGRDGASSAWFAALAVLPLLPLPGGGRQHVQPVHIDDLTHAIVQLVELAPAPRCLAAVGADAMALRDYLAVLRRAMCWRPGRVVAMPMAIVRAAVARPPFQALLDRETLGMLERGNTATTVPFAQVLGRAPRAPAQFVNTAVGAQLRREAALRLSLPLLRFTLAVLWLVSGIVSLGLYPVADSLALLARVGVHGTPALLLLYSGAAVDIVLGIATLLIRRRWLWLAQLAVVIVYSAIITVKLPEFWLHPYAPLVKNLPILALLWFLYLWDGR